MEKIKIEEIIKQVLYNPQVSYPALSYVIEDKNGEDSYKSEYIDIEDFKKYLERLEKQLIIRLTN